MMDEKQILLNELKAEKARRLYRDNYYEYVIHTNRGYKRTKLHEKLCNTVQDFIEKDTGNPYDILLLSVPPQHGKSLTITESLPSWYAGHNPDHGIIVAGYSGEFVKRFGRRNRDKILEFGKDIFNVELSDDVANTSEYELKGYSGRTLFAGILGGITGNRANLIIIDDPIKTREEAFSETTREKLKEEFNYSIKSRLADGTKIIVIQTRWHEDDLYGWISRHDPYCTTINIPLECEDEKTDFLGRKVGDALLPEIGKGKRWMKGFKKSYTMSDGMQAWNALYQGRPSAKAGNIFLTEDWQYYDTLPEMPYSVISVDASFKGGVNNDFVAIQVWGKRDDKFYLIDAIKQRLGFTDTLEAIKMFMDKYPYVWYVLVEDKANGSAIIDVLSRETEKVIPVEPVGGKESRAHAVSHLFRKKQVFVPRYSPLSADLIRESAEFPNGSHDDQVDAMTQALNRIMYVEAHSEDYVEPVKARRWEKDMFEDYFNATIELQHELIKMWGEPSNWHEIYLMTEE